MFVWYFTSVVGIVIALVYYCCKRHSSPSVRQRAESSHYEQHHSKATTKNVVAIDCEMVRCVPDEKWLENARKCNKKRVAVSVRCAIVDYDLQVIYNEFICPPMEVKDWQGYHRSHHQEQVKEGTPFYNAREKVRKLLRGKLVVVHHFYHDFDAIQICFEIPKDNIRDTSTFKPLRNKAREDIMKPYAKLTKLAKAILGLRIQKTKPHDPVEDAMELYKVVEQEWEE